MHPFIFTQRSLPFSSLPGASCDHIDQKRMYQMAKNKQAYSAEKLAQILQAHRLFLDTGGAGGLWSTVVINGIVLGLYDHKLSPQGEQAHLEHGRLADATHLEQQVLPFSNCCGLYAPSLQAFQTDLSYSLLTDAYFRQANFRQARLKKADFSRALLQQVDFREADLRHADFENCDLRGADLRGALLQGARFPGARLEGIIL